MIGRSIGVHANMTACMELVDPSPADELIVIDRSSWEAVYLNNVACQVLRA